MGGTRPRGQVAEPVGFEPTEPGEGSTDFKSAAFVHSATAPRTRLTRLSWRDKCTSAGLRTCSLAPSTGALGPCVSMCEPSLTISRARPLLDSRSSCSPSLSSVVEQPVITKKRGGRPLVRALRCATWLRARSLVLPRYSPGDSTATTRKGMPFRARAAADKRCRKFHGGGAIFSSIKGRICNHPPTAPKADNKATRQIVIPTLSNKKII